MIKKFRDFESARNFVKSLGLRSKTEWRKYAKSHLKPSDIPSAPNQVYKKQWKGWGDWVGTGRIATFNMQYRDFESARKFVHSLGLKSQTGWRKYIKSGTKPNDIPSNPQNTYKKQWKGMGDWLGTGRIATFNMQYRDFESARKFVHSLGLKSETEWRKYAKSHLKPSDIPSAPNQVYKKQWKGMGDWLGTGRIADQYKQYRDFESARKFVHSLGLKSETEWRDFSKSNKKPLDIPTGPGRTYKNKGWKGYGDWLGTGRIATFNIQFRDFESAKEFVRKLGLKNFDEWREFCKSPLKPADIPTHPDRPYKKQWKGWGDWLGTGNVRPQDIQFRDFESARKFVHSLGLKSETEWRKYIKSGTKPNDIPYSPEQSYKNKGWKGVGDWLGTGRIADKYKQFRDFESARRFVHSLGLKSETEWRKYAKSHLKPSDIPSAPNQVYKKQWKGMGDWVGTGRVASQEISKNYLPFKEARVQVRALAKKYNLKNWEDYQNAVKKGLIPRNIPLNPRNVYSKKRKRNGKAIP